ncbi:4-(cytidine 5'-diphospho)-2-C-methyl-D-erythritol kinase [Desulfospira joergensenii]|uniref:4-(cytidine 5'-diphospho)-2-C-methyl-D-erythritol kinase n=1 Tax=Desulfospira joergensenii TaxID=53329 RepID=UPI0003B77B82|nr:4-(cytidine 5'-diphospho)-2-C-methyl-D-erythritol kinase [Desulfospira joergensenii]
MRVFSPAKINLFLHVLGELPDGFHELFSLMVPIDFGDDLEFSFKGKGISVSCNHPGVPDGSPNLAHRAGILFFDQYRNRTGQEPLAGVDIRIDKRIPPGGGLGGGSSNAATVLMTLNKKCGNIFTRNELMDMGFSLGADVPFFIFGGAAFARGRGEKLEKAENLPKRHLVLCDPGVEASTAKVFKNLDLCLTSKGKYTINTGSNVLIRGNGIDLEQGLHNDLEETACRLYPEIKSAREEMEMLLGQRVLMSGSGSSLFALFSGPEQAEQGGETLQRQWQGGSRKLFVSSFQIE